MWQRRREKGDDDEANYEERRLNLTGVKLTLVGSPCIQYGDFLIESGWLLLRRSPDKEIILQKYPRACVLEMNVRLFNLQSIN